MTSTASPATSSPSRRVPLAAATAAVLTGAASGAIALVSVPIGVPQIPQLTPIAVVLFSVVASVVGALGWQLVRRRAADPRRTVLILALTVLAVSFVPDVLLGLALAATTGPTPVVALALMHLTTMGIAVVVYAWLLPLGTRPTGSRR